MTHLQNILASTTSNSEISRSEDFDNQERSRTMARRNISSGSAFEAEIGYSRAVVTGDWILVSGTTGSVPFLLTTSFPFQTIKTNNNPSYDYATGVLGSSVVEQTEQTLKNIEAALKEADATLKDVVRVRYILPDKKEFPLIWPVLKRVFGDVRPAATMIQAELMKDEMRIEIEVTAKKEHSDGFGAPL